VPVLFYHREQQRHPQQRETPGTQAGGPVPLGKTSSKNSEPIGFSSVLASILRLVVAGLELAPLDL
jgi:hypothetical protein